MKFGDAFYVFTRKAITVPSYKFPAAEQQIWIDVIEKNFYIADVEYFNGKKTIQLCSCSPQEIEDRKQKKYAWAGTKGEYSLERQDDKTDLWGSFYTSLEIARAMAKDCFTKDQLKTSKSGIKIHYLDCPESKNKVFSLV